MASLLAISSIGLSSAHGQSEIQATRTPSTSPTSGTNATRIFLKCAELRVNAAPTRRKDQIPSIIATSQGQFPARLTAIQNEQALAAQAATNLQLPTAVQFAGTAGWMASPHRTTAGSPIFIKSSNFSAAQLIKTNQVWPTAIGGTVPPGLTGSGRTLLMWDGGSNGVP